MSITLAERLRRARICQGMTQAGLARATGITRQTIHAIESGRKGTQAPTAKRLATALCVPVLWLLEGIGQGPDECASATPHQQEAPAATRASHPAHS